MFLGIGVGIPQSALTIGGSAAPTPESTLAELLATNCHAAWSPADTSTDSMSASRVSVTQVVADGAIGQLFDRKGSMDLIAGNDSQRPTLTGGLITFDGLDDAILHSGSPPLPSATLEFLFLVQSSHASNTFFAADNASAPVMVWENGNAGAPIATGSGSAYVDGNLVATRDAFADAGADGAGHLVEWRGLVGSEFAGFFRFSSPTTVAIQGAGLPLCILNTGQADIADQRLAAAAYAAALLTYFGI